MEDINNYQKIIFELITIQKWSGVEEILNKDIIDPDIRDSAGNYLIHLLIYYNQLDLLNLILKLNPRLDILDLDGKQLCYLPIRYNQINIIKVLLEYNSINYGIDITNFRDAEQHSPLFYAVKFNNVAIAKLLLDYGARLTIYDSDRNTPLHMASLNNNEEIIKLFMNYYPNISKSINNKKQIPLHLSLLKNYNSNIIKLLLKNNKQELLNAQDINDRTSLMYAIELGFLSNNVSKNNDLFETSMELQDADGNTHYHLGIKYNLNLELLEKPSKTALQKTDIDGNTILHLLLQKNLSNYFPDILENSSFLIQNNNGDTVLHYLCPDKWKNYQTILEHHKLSIYLKNKNNASPFSIIYDTKNTKLIDEFIYTVATSYYNQLKIKKDIEYISQWENSCNSNKMNKDNCYKNIYENIKNGISYPQKKKNYCIEITKTMVSKSMYSGITLDIIGGLLILNKLNTVTTSLELNILKNNTVESFYKNNRMIRTDFLNFEILWIYQTIFFPTGLEDLFKSFLNNKKRYFIIPIGIDLSQGSHANILIYDKKYNSLERFEPNGSTSPNNFFYFPDELDTNIYQYFSKLIDNIIYYSPIESSPKISFQKYEILETNSRLSDPRGYCGAWCNWYAYQRIKSGLIMPKLIPKLLQKIRGNNYSFKHIIRNYANYMANMRDKILKKSKITLDEWFMNIQMNQLELIEKNIKQF